eukprot:scaffold7841_cov128-Isochrysis_galbana.AAC.12
MACSDAGPAHHRRGCHCPVSAQRARSSWEMRFRSPAPLVPRFALMPCLPFAPAPCSLPRSLPPRSFSKGVSWLSAELLTIPFLVISVTYRIYPLVVVVHREYY